MDKTERQALIERVIRLQNEPANQGQDHVTICGFFRTRQQFENHIADLERRRQLH